MQKNCSDVEPLLPGYAIEALDADERDLVDRHLEVCNDCSTALTDFLRVQEGLLYVPSPIQPPPRVQARLIASLSDEPREATPMKRVRGWSLGRVAIGVAIVAMLFLNLALLSQSLKLQERVDTLAAKQEYGQTAFALANDPGARTVTISGEGAGGTLLYDPRLDIAVATLWGLEPLPADLAYQAWLISPDGGRTSGGLLQPDPESDFAVLVIQSPKPLTEFVGFGMTIEPSEGSPGPTGQKVVGAEL
ncbi:MAG: hypothetical protein GTO18_15040 [Anaerolineales bacterium]|nr:hypothetical protein [Anaerolineales bacterium]